MSKGAGKGMGLFTLAGVVFPDGDFSGQAGLFYREREELADLGDGHAVRARRCSFDTWMNLFAAAKWYRYCELGALSLHLEARGLCRVEVLGHRLDVAHAPRDEREEARHPGRGVVTECLLSEARDFGDGAEADFPVPDASAYDGISFSVIGGKDAPFPLLGAAWRTDRAPLRRHRLAIVACTYRRERYIRKNIQKFRAMMEAHPELSGRVRLIVADNGRTLEAGPAGEHAEILPNRNAGGAGGFARGLLAAEDWGATRCLFMDDDVELCPESLLRTLALTEYFKEDQKDAFVNGAMLSLHDRQRCTESLTVRNGFWLRGYYAGLDVGSLYGTLKCVSVGDNVYRETMVSSSWWFACFSMGLYRGERPIPCFIRGDDCEWSWRRRGVHHVSMNGVCVWHTPFDFNTRRMIDHYFLPRNMFLVHSIYNPRFREDLQGYLGSMFRHFMRTCNYASAELELAAMRDILHGWKSFAEAPEDLMARLKGITAEMEAVPCGSAKELEAVRDGEMQGLAGDEGAVVDWFPPESEFRGRKRVRVYNLVTRTYETRRPDAGREERQRSEYGLLMARIDAQYDALAAHLREGFEIFRTRAFWEEYLGLAEGGKDGVAPAADAGGPAATAPAAGAMGAGHGQAAPAEAAEETREAASFLAAAYDAVCRLPPKEPGEAADGAAGEDVWADAWAGAGPARASDPGPAPVTLEAALQDAMDQQAIHVLAGHFEESAGRATEAAEGIRSLRLRCTGREPAAHAVALAREALRAGDFARIRGWQESVEGFCRDVARDCREHPADEGAGRLLDRCLAASAEKYSDFSCRVECSAGAVLGASAK